MSDHSGMGMYDKFGNRVGTVTSISVGPLEKTMDLLCPNCRSRSVKVIPPQGAACNRCPERGTIAYFTPTPVDERSPDQEHTISRTFDVPDDEPDSRHVKAVTNAMMLLTQAAQEERWAIDWATLRIVCAANPDERTVTYLAVAKAHDKPALTEHEVGGVAVMSGGAAKVVKPTLTPAGPENLITVDANARWTMFNGKFIQPDAGDIKLAEQSRND